MTNLTGLQTLLVRAIQPDDSKEDIFVRQLRSEGASIHPFPVMETVAIDQSTDIVSIGNYLHNYTSYKKAFFVSKSSVYFLLDWLKNNFEKYPKGLPLGPRYYAIGKTTADALKNININADHPKKDFSSEGLLGLPSLLVGGQQKVIIFSGVGGRQLLSNELKSRGFLVDDCELYNRKCLKDFSTEINRLISKDVLDVVIVHSAELLENLLSQTAPTNLFTLKLLTLLVPSERIRLLAQNLGFKKIICSPSASTEQMVSVMRECYSNQL